MRNDRGFESSLLTKPPVIAAWLVFCVIAVLFGKTAISVFLGFVFALTLLSYLWARSALDGVEYTFEAERTFLFPGQYFTVTRTIRNRKALPLIWAEIREVCEADEPAMPDEKVIVYRDEAPQGEASSPERIFERLYRISLVRRYRAARTRDTWQAKRRGIMEIGASTVRSGDGFGLCAIGRKFTFPSPKRIVVFPRLAKVSLSSILNEMWDTRSEAYGYLKDRTIIKAIRGYLPGDPAKDLNMRLLARSQGMQVNVFETVTPDSVLFILDTCSFRDAPQALFERSLSTLAGLIDGLTRGGLRVSLLTPASRWFGETCTLPSCEAAARIQMLELLAAVQTADAPLSAAFPASAEDAGKIYYICMDAFHITAPSLHELLPEDRTYLLTASGARDSGSVRLRARDLFDFERVS